MSRGFDGNAADYLSSTSIPRSTYPITMSCRFNLNAITNSQTLLYWGDKDAAAQRDCYQLRFRGNAESTNKRMLELVIGNSSTSQSRTSGTGNTYDTAGVWAAALVTTQTGNYACYLNGNGVASAGTVLVPNNVDLFAIGLDANTGSTQPTDGNISEVAIWNVVLNAQEIDSLVYFSPLLVRPSGLVFYAPLLGDADPDFIGQISITENGTLTTEDNPYVIRPASV